MAADSRYFVELIFSVHLDPAFKAEFPAFVFHEHPDGSTVCSGEVEDITAFYGIVVCLRDQPVQFESLQAVKQKDAAAIPDEYS